MQTNGELVTKIVHRGCESRFCFYKILEKCIKTICISSLIKLVNIYDLQIKIIATKTNNYNNIIKVHFKR